MQPKSSWLQERHHRSADAQIMRWKVGGMNDGGDPRGNRPRYRWRVQIAEDWGGPSRRGSPCDVPLLWVPPDSENRGASAETLAMLEACQCCLADQKNGSSFLNRLWQRLSKTGSHLSGLFEKPSLSGRKRCFWFWETMVEFLEQVWKRFSSA